MLRLLNCKIEEDHTQMLLDEETDDDQCPTSMKLQEQLRVFCAQMVEKVSIKKENGNGDRKMIAPNYYSSQAPVDDDQSDSWVDVLARLLVSVPPKPNFDAFNHLYQGTKNFQHLIVDTLKRWANESKIDNNNLIRFTKKLQIFLQTIT